MKYLSFAAALWLSLPLSAQARPHDDCEDLDSDKCEESYRCEWDDYDDSCTAEREDEDEDKYEYEYDYDKEDEEDEDKYVSDEDDEDKYEDDDECRDDDY
jgi:hypothetical protein